MTSTDLTPISDEPQGSNLPAKMEYARTLAASSLLPKSYRGQPANVLIALELGQALGIPPIQAINGIHVIEGQADRVRRAHRQPRPPRRPQAPHPRRQRQQAGQGRADPLR